LLPPGTGSEENGQLTRYGHPVSSRFPCVTPEHLAKFRPAEIAKWAGPIKASGVSMD
jgi:hypothetical protein